MVGTLPPVEFGPVFEYTKLIEMVVRIGIIGCAGCAMRHERWNVTGINWK